MKIVAVSDTHEEHTKIHIPECDIFIHAGDAIEHKVNTPGILDFAKWIKDIPAKHKIIVPGNHDYVFEDTTNIALFIEKAGQNTFFLKDNLAVIEGLRFYGMPWTPRFGNWAFMHKDPKRQEYIAAIPEGIDILITHGAPYKYLDEIYTGHIGDVLLLDRIKNIMPKYHFFGHIHEGYGRDEYIDDEGRQVNFVNCAVCNMYYEPINKPQEIIL